MFHLGIIGYPLSHTLSPAIHRVFLDETGLPGEYQVFELQPERLGDWIAGPTARGLNGFNVTIPHKVGILPLLDEISDEVRQIGAVNTVVRRDNRYIGFNTDVYGFLEPLTRIGLDGSLFNAHAVVLGAGGASRAVAYALLSLGVSRLTFWSRSPDKARATLNASAAMARLFHEGATDICYWSKPLGGEHLSDAALVVNTTPVGMTPYPEASPLTPEQLAYLPESALVYDLVYNPLETRLLQYAKDRGLRGQDGLDMLIGQAAEAFRIWTGQPVAEATLCQTRQDVITHLLCG